ncbi:hypothetical protein LEP1GSC065_3114 [Leptospira kirschneri serovar Sokoine str. RM1]|nr:hypothetical protein LEP1GSC065_3114 [Leptospira kirschneri serovar Sokoine str. RM1]
MAKSLFKKTMKGVICGLLYFKNRLLGTLFYIFLKCRNCYSAEIENSN